MKKVLNKNPGTIKQIFGAWVRICREDMGLTQKEFGQLFEPPKKQAQISRWEKGIGLSLSSIEKIYQVVPNSQLHRVLGLPQETPLSSMFGMVSYLSSNLTPEEQRKLNAVMSSPRGRHLFLEISQALVAPGEHFRQGLHSMLALVLQARQTEY